MPARSPDESDGVDGTLITLASVAAALPAQRGTTTPDSYRWAAPGGGDGECGELGG